MKRTVIAGAAVLLSLLAGTVGAQDREGANQAINNNVGAHSSNDTDIYNQAVDDYNAKRYTQAAGEFKDYLKSNGKDVQAYRLLATSYILQNKPAEAVPELETALKLAPKDTDVRDILGIAYLQAGSSDKAAALYQTALVQSPKDPKLAFQYAVSLEQGGKHTEAAAAFEKAATLDPKDSQAPLDAGLLYHQMGNDTKAVPLLKNALALGTTEQFKAYSVLAGAAYAAKQSNEAIQDYTLAAQAKPDDFGTYANLGVLNQNAGKKPEAKAAYQKAVTLKTDDAKSLADVQSNLSVLLIEDGKLDEAVTLLTQAAAGDPTDARIQDNLGQVYEKQGKKTLAIAAYKKALTIDPTLADAKERLAPLSK